MAHPSQCECGNDTPAEIRPGERASDVVIRSVAAVTSREPLALSPLHNSIDAGALDRLVRDARAPEASHAPAPDASSTVTIRFEYEGCEVCVVDDAVHVKRR
ncbi:HalOD1 output domain-containing protein [Halosolutus halophilus]|uniref:HalOD1 output domain-containing protein n=1 Tax=Halosolutus halophilus TaxID=1552990 RepID=UPI0022350BAF|nr:HalOD1 output domain-containing protein [Halosolutus halophilus]